MPQDIIPVGKLSKRQPDAQHSRQIDPAAVFLAAAAMPISESAALPRIAGLVLVQRHFDDVPILDDSALACPELAGDTALTITWDVVGHWIVPVG